MIGWDFDTRVEMHDTQAELQGPLRIGDYLEWLVKRNPDLDVYILRWDAGAWKTFFRGSMLWQMTRWQFHPRIHIKLDGRHPFGGAHHQKIAVIDDDVAFCGGIDVTGGRWDTRAHENRHLHRKQPEGADAGPWHDTAFAAQGEIASALAKFTMERWRRSGAKPMKTVGKSADSWPDGLEPMFENVDIAIAETQPKMPDLDERRHIEQLYLDLISTAHKSIYAESQYFASRRLASAIASRLDEPDGPEIVIVNPVSADGWLEVEAMDTTRARIFAGLKQRDRHNRFRLYHPVTDEDREIYVHAKLVIVDDRIIRVGSSNFNNRSMGLDTECDLAIDAGDAKRSSVHDRIAEIRTDLLAEHLGATPKDVAGTHARTGSLIQTIEHVRKPGRTLRDYQPIALAEAEKWLADNEILDPNDPDDVFPAILKPGWPRVLKRFMRPMAKP